MEAEPAVRDWIRLAPLFVAPVFMIASQGLFELLGLVGLLLGQLLFIALVAACGWLSGGRLREVFQLRSAPVTSYAGSVLMASGLVVVGSALFRLQSAVFPPPAELIEGFTELAESVKAAPRTALWTLAVVPAVGEELLFRGLVLGLLSTRLGNARGVLMTAMVFALFHVSPHRFVVTLLLGLVLGAMVIATGSVLPAMLLHGIYNALLMIVGQRLWDASLQPGWLAAAVLVSVLGAALSFRSCRPGRSCQPDRARPPACSEGPERPDGGAPAVRAPEPP